MSWLDRLLGRGAAAEGGGAPQRTREDAAGSDQGDAGDGPDEPLSEDLRAFLAPRNEFVARQQRYAAYRWEPPANEPQRDPRLAPLTALAAAVRAADATQLRAVTDAYRRRPRAFDAALRDLEQSAGAAGRDGDVRAARAAFPREPDEPEQRESAEADPLRLAFEAAAQATVARDLIPPDRYELLMSPWRAGFPDAGASSPR